MGGYDENGRVIILDDEDSKEFILAWFEFFRNEFPSLDCFRRNASESLSAVLDSKLSIRNGISYDKPPAAREMAPVYVRMTEKYNSVCIVANPKVWYDMDMDTKVSNFLYAYYL